VEKDFQKYAVSPSGSKLYFDNGPLNSGDIRIDGITNGAKWGGPVGTGAIISYSFPTVKSVWADDYATGFVGKRGDEPNTGFSAFTENEKSMVRDAMDMWEDAGNIIFVEVQETPTEVGIIRFGWTALYTGDPAYSSRPGPWGRNSDVWWHIDGRDHITSNYAGFVGVLTHELGHALGLSHGVDGTTNLPKDLDHQGNTIMSYNQAPHTEIDKTGMSRPKMFDILAITYLYGAKNSTDLFNPS